MKVLRQNQYNQGISKFKLLSSTSGVGSIITSKHGSYILISDINKWKFLHWANSKVGTIREETSDDIRIYNAAKKQLSLRGITFIDDKRFVNFIKREKQLNNLVCLIGIPQMSLNESFNTPNWKFHPIKTALDQAGENGSSTDYMIKGSHFPKWFRNKKGELKKINEWLEIWLQECGKHMGNLTKEHFAPPRDGNHYKGKEVKSKNEDGTPINIREYEILEQTNLVLICPNGHLSDMPWPQYLKWKTEKELRIRGDDDRGGNLFSLNMCCSKPQLKWTESTTKSEGYASVFIECLNCGLGNGIDRLHPKINLEGINGLQPNCPGQKPWEMKLETSETNIPSEHCYIRNETSNGNENLRVALVTANNVYFASGFSSIFIPLHLAENKSPQLIEGSILIENKYQKHYDKTNITKDNFWSQKFNFEDFIIDNDLVIADKVAFEEQLKTMFLATGNELAGVDFFEHYRWQEYQCFCRNNSIPDIPENIGLKFKDILLSEELNKYFTKIQQIEDLKVTNVQLEFTRIRPKERIVVNGDIQTTTNGKNIFSIDSNELFVLPANETLGEGLFFQFNESALEQWQIRNASELNLRFAKYLEQIPDVNSQGASIKVKIFNNRFRQFLIHTFSHILMRELEFSCGYPTASLKERLYISGIEGRSMCGVLIYTAEGSEGSMGGLVSQGDDIKISRIIKKGLTRTNDCTSDPLCWESDGQGIFDLNLAACFSCSMVSETACEEHNLGLDRRVLVDEDCGYFKELLLNA